MIPVTDKLWVKCKFDENFNEVSYIDNHGTSYEFIDPVKSHLKFYKADGIDISQDLLDKLKYKKAKGKKKSLFIKSFSDLTLKLGVGIALGETSLCLCTNNGIPVIKYFIGHSLYYIDRNTYIKYNQKFKMSYYEINNFLMEMLQDYLGLTIKNARINFFI